MQPVTEVLQKEPTLISNTHYCVVGDVAIDDSSAIAPGVVLQASPGSRIVIGKGVCIAAGVCIQSRSGLLTISSGVSLGANVLIIGKGTVGANACISPGSTIINPTVEAGAILPPSTLIGASPTVSNDTSARNAASSYSNQSANNFQSNGFQSNGFQNSSSQNSGTQNGGFQSDRPPIPHSSSTNGYIYSKPSQATASSTPQPEPSNAPFKNTFVEPGPVAAKPISIPDLSDQTSTFVPPPPLNQPLNQTSNPTNNVQSNYGSSSLTVHSSNEVYGKTQVNQLISALFPSRQSLNNDS